jgi:hypothetical protein
MNNFSAPIVQRLLGAILFAYIEIWLSPAAEAQVCDTEAFLLGAYHDLLGFDQDPSDEDAAAWEEIIDGGLLTREQVALGITNTAEYRMHLVDVLYNLYLDRDADDAEKLFFNFLLSSGKTFEYLAVTILGSDEYFEDQGGGNNGGFLVVLYNDVLGRALSDAEYNKQLKLLTQGASRAAIAEKLLLSKEGRQKLIQDVYEELLGRAPTAKELKAWLSKTVSTRGSSSSWRYEVLRANLIGSQEYCFLASPAVGGSKKK